jgi:hypothetical protein
LITLRASETRIIPVLPLPLGITKEELNGQHELPDIVRKPEKWPVLRYAQREFAEGERILEPGEEDQLHAEFKLPAGIQVLCIASHVANPKNPKVGWERITIYDIDKPTVKETTKGKVKTKS